MGFFVNVRICRVERVLDSAGTSVAPPERTARLPTASFLPSAPTLSSSRARIDREPEITHVATSEEESEGNEVGEKEGLESDEDDGKVPEKNAISPLRFGPPKGHSHSGQGEEAIVIVPVDSNVMYFIIILFYLLLFLDTHSGQGEEDIVTVPVDSNVMYFITILFYLLLFLDIDLANLPHLERQPPANGSSRSTGGILRGRALGNAPNIGDPFDDVQQDVKPLSRGRVNVTIVQHPPGDLVIENPTSHLKVMSPCYETLGPLLKKVAKSYSPVRSKCSYN